MEKHLSVLAMIQDIRTPYLRVDVRLQNSENKGLEYDSQNQKNDSACAAHDQARFLVAKTEAGLPHVCM
jgi:hypothetical protein